MKGDHVNSRAIASLGYDAATRTLEIEFVDGDVYDYFEVPAELYHLFRHANSLGGFFAHQVRERFRYTKR